MFYDELTWNPCAFGGPDSHRTRLLLSPGSSPVRGPLGVTVQLRSSHSTPLPDRRLQDGAMRYRCKAETRSFSEPTSSVNKLLRTFRQVAVFRRTVSLSLEVDVIRIIWL